MADYILYLDESETFSSPNRRYFSVGGVVISTHNRPAIETDIIQLKSRLWDGDPNSSQYILHEKEISDAHHSRSTLGSCYHIFRQNNKLNQLYGGLSQILRNHNIVTIGVCIDQTALNQAYGPNTTNRLTIALQLLLENYCHFLNTHNSTGDICYESLQEPGNKPLRQRFYELEALGTMYYPSEFFQIHIGDIYFQGKVENVPGLQLADFIPNTLCRVAARLSPKERSFKDTVLRRLYDGNMNNRQKYGFKVIP